jgi:GAF domain-containing protein
MEQMMSERSFDEYKQMVQEQGQVLLDAIQSVALGNLDVAIEVPEGVEILSDLAIGLEMMIDDIREMIAEQERARGEVERARQELDSALNQVLAVQRRYVREGWESYTDRASEWAESQGSDGYVISLEGEGPTSDDWLPAMSSAIRQVGYVTESDDPSVEGQSTLAMPIAFYGEVFGALGFSREGQEWSEGELEVVRSVVDQVAQALENQRLLDEQQRVGDLMSKRVQELNSLNEIGLKIAENPDTGEFLTWVLERIPPVMQYPEDCAIAIEFEGQLYGSQQAVDLPHQIVQGLRIGDDLAGRICVAYTKAHDFLNEESALLGNIARRVSDYVERRRLLAGVRAAAARDRRIRTATDRIHRAADAESIVRTTLEELGDMLGASRLVVRLGTRAQLQSSAIDSGAQKDSRDGK